MWIISLVSGIAPVVGVEPAADSTVTDTIEKGLAGATRRDRTGDLLITNQPLYQLS
jgi:hypothetical protein